MQAKPVALIYAWKNCSLSKDYALFKGRYRERCCLLLFLPENLQINKESLEYATNTMSYICFI